MPLFAGTNNEKKIALINKYIQTKHAEDHKKVVYWMKNPGSERPEVSPKLIRAYEHFARLYKLENQEKKARVFEATVQRLTRQSAPAVDQVERRASRPKVTAEVEKSYWYLTFGYGMISDKVTVTSSTLDEETTSSFSGMTIGGGADFSNNLGFEAQYLLLNGTVETTGYKQEKAVLGGFYLSGNYQFHLSDSFKINTGLAAAMKTLKTGESPGTEAKLKSGSSFGPEALIHWNMSDSLFLKIGGAYFQSGPALRLNIGYVL